MTKTAQNKSEISFEEFLRGMTPSAFEMFGLNQLSYVKASNDHDYVLYSANGQILANYKTMEHALNASKEQDLKTVTVH